MRTPAVVRVFVGAVCLAAIGLVGVILIGAPSRAQPPTKSGAAQATPPASGASDAKAGPAEEGSRDPELDEQTLLAREEVEILELQIGSKKAQLKKAETRFENEQAQVAEYEKAKKFGIGSSMGQKRVDLGLLEVASERSRIQAELTETEKRYMQAKRRLAMIARRGPAATGILERIGRDLRELERRVTKIEEKIDLLVEKTEQATSDISRINQLLKLR